MSNKRKFNRKRETRTCQPGQFQCEDKTCIFKCISLCDSVVHCADNSDGNHELCTVTFFDLLAKHIFTNDNNKYLKIGNLKIKSYNINAILQYELHPVHNTNVLNSSNISTNDEKTECHQETLFCEVNHHCYNKRYRCVFDTDSNGRLQFCESGNHLGHCEYHV